MNKFFTQKMNTIKKTDLKLKKFVFGLVAIFALLIVSPVFSQVTYTGNPTNAAINSVIQGGNVTVSGGTSNRGSRVEQIATFTGGIPAGLSMATGVYFGTGKLANDLSINNTPVSSQSAMGSSASDINLSSIDPTATRDVVSYSFNVTLGAQASILYISYQFGSEEYPDYVGSAFDDAFGFFVTGPGVGTANLARLPNGQVTTINKLNYGIPGFSSAVIVPAYDGSQSALYINNGHSTTVVGGKLIQNTNPGPKPIAVQFNGITKLISYSISGLTPGATYTFKIAIGDNDNTAFDSGVFIDAIFGSAVIVAVNDTQTISAGSTGVVSVLNNDTVNSSAATLSMVALSQVSTTNSGVTLNPATGLITVAPGTPAGIYSVVYQICDIGAPSICKTATATITLSTAVKVLKVSSVKSL
jgi:hypothetical protein